MPNKKRLTIEIPEEIFEEVEKYKESTQKPSHSAAVTALLKYALTLPPYFKDYDWEEAEKEADEDIKAGRVKSFDTVEEFLTDLKG